MPLTDANSNIDEPEQYAMTATTSFTPHPESAATTIEATGTQATQVPELAGLFDGLLPVAAAPAGAANDDVAPDEDEESSSGPTNTPDTQRAEANMKLRRAVGPRLFRARELSGYSQTEAAQRFGYKTPAQLSQWEMGRRMAPIEKLVHASVIYCVSLDYLLGVSPEPERDPSAGARHAVLRGVRGMLERVAVLTVTEIDRHQRLVGPHAGNVRGLLENGDSLLEAFGAFVRHNDGAFANQRGGATLQRRAQEFEAALEDSRTAIRAHDALDGDLRRALAALGDADPLPTNDMT